MSKVVVGMSGGVDSSVAAYLLKQQGYEVIGVTMQIWQDDSPADSSGGCCGLSAADDARRVAESLDIPYYVLNFKKDFKERVIDYFIDEYMAGRTPNPCIACNRYVKWESMLQKAMQLGADYIATGHYARLVKHPVTGRFCLQKSATDEKDQTYALYNLTQEQLSRTLMPVGDYTKEQIRQIANDIGLKVANKPDSQEICFIPDNDYGRFIEESGRYTGKQGDFTDTSGKVLGRHKGIAHYTVGQRKGLGISLGKPMFVKKIDPLGNKVILSDNEELFSTELTAGSINFMAFESLREPTRLKAKIRYSHKAADCVAQTHGNVLTCTFDTAQRAITPGQAVVLYDNGYVVGGGVIL